MLAAAGDVIIAALPLLPNYAAACPDGAGSLAVALRSVLLSAAKTYDSSAASSLTPAAAAMAPAAAAASAGQAVAPVPQLPRLPAAGSARVFPTGSPVKADAPGRSAGGGTAWLWDISRPLTGVEDNVRVRVATVHCCPYKMHP